MNRPTLLLLLLATAVPALAQDARALCFGVSFDGGCRVMVQYEVGYRGRVLGREPSSSPGGPGESSRSRHEWFGGGGLMFPRGDDRALGVIYQVAAGRQLGQSLGVRYARAVDERIRLDLTGGVDAKRLDVFSANGYEGTRDQPGVFIEAALHRSNFLTVLARDEAHGSYRGVTGGNALLLGGRLERIPALGATALAAAFVVAVLYGASNADF
jgi:hypothetical protein